MSMQADLFADRPAGPEGLVYRRDFLTPGEEVELLARFEALPFAPFRFQRFVGKRMTVSFGWQYRFDGTGLAPAEPMPDWLLALRAGAEAATGLSGLEHALILQYEESAGIGLHKDRPDFGEVVGISLGAAVPLRFRRKAGAKWERFALTAEPRSLYHLSGPARTEWEHSILAVPALRYSITLRTLRRAMEK